MVRPADEFLNCGNTQLGALTSLQVPTPGHSIGSVSFVFPEFVLSGDALFNGSVGRTDLPTGNLEQLLNGIRDQLFVLPDEFPVYPGHGPATTILKEKRTNPFFN